MNKNRNAKRLAILTLLACLLVACATPKTDIAASAITPAAATSTPTPAPTHTPPPEPTTTETATTSPTPTPVPSATPSPTQTSVPSTPVPEGTPLPTPEPGTYTVVGVRLDDTLNVRAGAGVDHEILGTLAPYASGIEVVGDGIQVGQSVWVPIQRGEVEGWVNSRYLARQVGEMDEAIAQRAASVVFALHDKDLAALSTLVHPEKGLRFSPYAYVHVDEDVVLSADEIAGIGDSQEVYHWGVYDGTGNPIDLTFDEYWDLFVYDVDLTQAHIVGYNELVGRGNTIANHGEVYPLAATVEYHFTGFDPRFEGMDWRSLRLVLEQADGRWYLVGLIHDEWTI